MSAHEPGRRITLRLPDGRYKYLKWRLKPGTLRRERAIEFLETNGCHDLRIHPESCSVSYARSDDDRLLAARALNQVTLHDYNNDSKTKWNKLCRDVAKYRDGVWAQHGISYDEADLLRCIDRMPEFEWLRSRLERLGFMDLVRIRAENVKRGITAKVFEPWTYATVKWKGDDDGHS